MSIHEGVFARERPIFTSDAEKVKWLEKDSETLTRAFVELQQRLENEEYQRQQLKKENQILREHAESIVRVQDKLLMETAEREKESNLRIELSEELQNSTFVIEELNKKLEALQLSSEEEKIRINSSITSLNIAMSHEAEKNMLLEKEAAQFEGRYKSLMTMYEAEKKRNESNEKQKEQAVNELHELEDVRISESNRLKEGIDALKSENDQLIKSLEQERATIEEQRSTIERLNEEIFDLKEEVLQKQEKLDTEARYADAEKIRRKEKLKQVRSVLEQERLERSNLSSMRQSEVTDLQESLRASQMAHQEAIRERDQWQKELFQKEQMITFKNKG